MADYIDTGNEFTNAIANLQKLLELNQSRLELRDIFNYDELAIPQTPAAAIVFDNGRPITKSLGFRCNLMEVNINLFIYLESLSLAQNNYEHIGRLGYLVKLLYIHSDLFGLCHSEHMEIRTAQIVGRRLDSDIYLTAQVDLMIPIRFCRETTP